MKIVHTGDWHLGSHLGLVDRRGDLCHALRQIAGYLNEHQVDVMLVAGDVFHRNRQDEIHAAIEDIKEIFSPFLTGGGTIIVISGNHDSEVFFETLRDALDLGAPGHAGPQNINATGRLYVAPNARTLRLADHGGNIVQFVLMPYPTPRNYLQDGETYQTLEEKHALLQKNYTQTLEALESRLDARLPSVLVSHIVIRGITTPSEYHLSETEAVMFEPGDIPTHWAYVAYGHIHQAQAAIPGAVHVRYAGSIERMDAGERDDQKSVVLCEVGPEGLAGEPQLLPLTSTPIYHLDITDPDSQLTNLAERYPDAERAIVSYILSWQPGKHGLADLRQRIEDIFPRCARREFREIGRDMHHQAAFTAQNISDVGGTVRRYLQDRLSTHARREALLALAEALLAKEERA